MSVGEVLDFIYVYVNMRSKTTKQNNKQQQKTNTSQEDTIFYGRVDENGNPMTLEQIMAME